MARDVENGGTLPIQERLERERDRRRNAERALRESRQRFEHLVNTIPCALYDYVRWPDGRSRFTYISPQCVGIFEYEAERIMQEPDLLWSMVHPDDVQRLREEDQAANLANTQFQSEVRIVLPSESVRWIQLTSMPSEETLDGCVIWSGVILDITKRKLAEEERNRVISELQDALSKVKTLSGLLPICASCKKIRDDKGYWNQIESYISNHSEAEFSHGLCPDCARKLFPSLKNRNRD